MFTKRRHINQPENIRKIDDDDDDKDDNDDNIDMGINTVHRFNDDLCFGTIRYKTVNDSGADRFTRLNLSIFFRVAFYLF